jgi:hypothetical protein
LVARAEKRLRELPRKPYQTAPYFIMVKADNETTNLFC